MKSWDHRGRVKGDCQIPDTDLVEVTQIHTYLGFAYVSGKYEYTGGRCESCLSKGLVLGQMITEGQIWTER